MIESIQSMGGKALFKQRGPEHFSKISKKGWKEWRRKKAEELKRSKK